MTTKSSFFLSLILGPIMSVATTYYVDAVNGDDGNDGTSADDAVMSMAAANALMTSNGDVLEIAPGTYVLTGEIANAHSVTFRGTDPNHNPGNVVINGNGVCRGFNLTGTSVRLEGLTVSNCFNSANIYGGGAYFSQGAVVTNCYFVANTNTCAKGCGGGIYSYGGSYPVTLVDTAFHLNYAKSTGGGFRNHTSTVKDTILRRCVFTDNHSDSEGGGGWSDRDGHNMALYDCTFIGNSSITAGAWGKCYYTMSNCYFRANIAKNAGVNYPGDYNGAKYVLDCVFEENQATNGVGGCFDDAKTGLRLWKCRFFGNRSTGVGSCVHKSAAVGEYVRDCVFGGNTGNVPLSGTYKEIANCVFTNNYGAYSCTDSAIAQNPVPVITNCIFRYNVKRNNRASNQTVARGAAVEIGSHGAFGAGAYVPYLIVDTEFTGNVISNSVPLAGNGNGIDSGGAVFAPGDCQIVRCGFTNNLCITDNGHGGAFGGTCRGGIRDCTFVGNSSKLGGALCFESDTYLMITGRIQNVISGCSFISNWTTTANSPSAIFVGQGHLKLDGCYFEGNSNGMTAATGTASNGAVGFNGNCGMMVSSQQHKTRYHPAYRMSLECDNTTFVGNYGIGAGGAISFYANIQTNSWSYGHIRNCLFQNNISSMGSLGAVTEKGWGGAIAIGSHEIAIENCTFTGNVAKGNAKNGSTGGAIKVTGTRTGITNCVFYANVDDVAGIASDDLSLADPSIAAYCFAKSGGALTDGVNGCIVKDQNPFRADDHCDLSVRRNCGQGAGLVLDWMNASTLDLGGKPRLSGNAVDFGCYQHYFISGTKLIVK